MRLKLILNRTKLAYKKEKYGPITFLKIYFKILYKISGN